MSDRSSIALDDPAIAALAPRPSVDHGRLGVYAVLGASVGALPIPWLPDSLVRRVRGAVVQDVAVRHGLSLDMEAREVLSDPANPDAPRGFVAQATRFLGLRLAVKVLTRVGPVGFLLPGRTAVQTYVLGHLFDRYLARARTERAVRVDVAEARVIRKAIDGAIARAITIEGAEAREPAVIDDQRDALTALVDGLLGLAASLPARLVGRLDAAFDELLSQSDG